MKKLAILLFLISTSAYAQKKDYLQLAQDALSAAEWGVAEMHFKKHLKKNETDSSVWFGLAQAQMNQNATDEAGKSFDMAEETNYSVQAIYFSKARMYASQNDPQNVIKTLKKGGEKGLATFAAIQNDSLFDAFKEMEGYQKAMNKIELNAYPCLSAENYRHFDFWIGEWDVYANGRKVGENFITRAKGGCAIHENYITQRNYAGQSINYYDPIDKLWHQHWVGSSGDVYNYLETDRGEGMLQFESKFMNPGGQITLSRLTFTLNDDGTVRQLFESSSDEGKTWTPAFDGLYKRRD